MVIEAALRDQPRELRRIVVHELFHFAWVRLSNASRRDWENVLAKEWRAKIPGELGWSGEWRKAQLGSKDVRARTRKWREYACESFCDSVAWLLTGGRQSERTLAPKWRLARQMWIERLLASPQGVAV